MRVSMRLVPRTGGGDWAMSSSGRSKWKSDTSTFVILVVLDVVGGVVALVLLW